MIFFALKYETRISGFQRLDWNALLLLQCSELIGIHWQVQSYTNHTVCNKVMRKPERQNIMDCLLMMTIFC